MILRKQKQIQEILMKLELRKIKHLKKYVGRKRTLLKFFLTSHDRENILNISEREAYFIYEHILYGPDIDVRYHHINIWCALALYQYSSFVHTVPCDVCEFAVHHGICSNKESDYSKFLELTGGKHVMQFMFDSDNLEKTYYINWIKWLFKETRKNGFHFYSGFGYKYRRPSYGLPYKLG